MNVIGIKVVVYGRGRDESIEWAVKGGREVKKTKT